ncbi:MAG TPA: hypothetical protein VJO15_09370, partial [Dehalococcoidia bacterium]|nr:hypothetical protein [Dehalococcoidia bacterium]
AYALRDPRANPIRSTDAEGGSTTNTRDHRTPQTDSIAWRHAHPRPRGTRGGRRCAYSHRHARSHPYGDPNSTAYGHPCADAYRHTTQTARPGLAPLIRPALKGPDPR